MLNIKNLAFSMILALSMNWTTIEKSTMRSYKSQCIAQEVRLWCLRGCNILPREQLQYVLLMPRNEGIANNKTKTYVHCAMFNFSSNKKGKFSRCFRWLIFSQWCALQANSGSLCWSLVPLRGVQWH